MPVSVAVAVAVLRYRQWDLDRLVSRTVTYALVTALLVVPYLLVVPAAAARTVAGFGGRLRDEVDLDAIAAELVAVVERTVQPTQASLWLRPPAVPPVPR